MLRGKGKLPKLAHVIEYGAMNEIHQLLSTGCDANASLGEDGWPPICCAVARRKRDVVEELLARGADPDQPVKNGMAEGMIALDFCADVSIARMLLDAGAQVDITDKQGWKPLEWARYLDRMDIVELLT